MENRRRIHGGAAVGLLMALALPALAQIPGDVDGSEIVDAADALLLVDHLTGSSPLTPEQIARAEANGQAGLDVGDLVWIVNHGGLPFPQMVSVPAGSFAMGSPWSGAYPDQLPVHTVYLSAYEIGRCEVTNAEYAGFLDAALAGGEIRVTNNVIFLSDEGSPPLFETAWANPNSQILHRSGTFSILSRDGRSMDDHPVVMVNWYGAAAYCNWLSRQQGFEEVYTESGDWPSDPSRNGYHLPTEAQWERAAGWDPDHTGSSDIPVPVDQPAQGRWRYGFMSDVPEIGRFNYFVDMGTWLNPLNLTTFPYTSPVGYFDGRSGTEDSSSPVGCYDMSGNVEEWCNDWYSPVYYGSSPDSNPEGPLTGDFRVQRGGAWGSNEVSCRSAFRNWIEPEFINSDFGFRIARNP